MKRYTLTMLLLVTACSKTVHRNERLPDGHPCFSLALYFDTRQKVYYLEDEAGRVSGPLRQEQLDSAWAATCTKRMN